MSIQTNTVSGYKYILAKLEAFTKRYYVNELIKGLILFISLGVLYFLFTLSIEFFLWLKPLARTVLFWVFVVVELTLLVKFIIIPLVKLIGLQKGLSTKEAAQIIGNHFPEVEDKLLNVIQLKQSNKHSELIKASIEQKSLELKPIPFKRAINFSTNKKYLKFAIFPIAIYALFWITGNSSTFNQSFDRVVKYNTQFEPPAPFQFTILNDNLEVVEGKKFELQIETNGEIVPNEAKIYFGEEKYYLNKIDNGKFSFLFENIQNTITFVLEANGVVSKNYKLNIINAPVINSIQSVLTYPPYIQKTNEVISNTGNLIVPEGTFINWQIATANTTNISFINNSEIYEFLQPSTNYFTFEKQAKESFSYQISSSNNKLTNYENLTFNVDVIKDEYPKISVESDVHNVLTVPFQFAGQLLDDYGISALQFVIVNNEIPSERKIIQIPINKSNVTDFYYEFDKAELLEPGKNYQFYFEVFDNDEINGSKKTRSSTFQFYNKTENQLQQKILENQQEKINEFSNTLKDLKQNTKEIKSIEENLQQKQNFNWNDATKLEQLLKRQEAYQKLIKEQSNQILDDLKKQPDLEKTNTKKEALQKRLDELKNFEKQNEMMKEMENLMKQLDKNELTQKLKQLSQKNKRNQKSLERILELTKRFYVEQKAVQIQEKLENLATKQEKNSNTNNEEVKQNQEEINQEFENIVKEFKELQQKNKELQRPMDFPDTDDDQNQISDDLKNIMEDLEKQNKTNTEVKKKQKSASLKMKTLSNKLQRNMQGMESEELEENIDDLRKIVENLIAFSFEQEDLLDKFSASNQGSANYPSQIKEQQKLKQFFEHIDDSLYVLSLRIVQMGSFIQNEVETVHFNIDESLKNFTDNQIGIGIANQQYAITSTNNLANELSDLLENMLNASAKMGKSNSGKNAGFRLPDIIQKQEELSKKMGEQLNNNSKGQNSENSEESNEALFEMYQEQAKLRDALQQLLKDTKGNSGKAVKQMESIEKELLNKGLSEELIAKIKQLQYELLKLENAQLEQGIDNQRKATENNQIFEQQKIRELEFKKKIKNNNEILNRQSLPLRTIYKKRVQEYFKNQ